MKQRADIVLVERGLASTRAQAKSLILEGKVKLNGIPLSKSSQQVCPEDEILVIGSGPRVSRGYTKLFGAINDFNVTVKNQVIADCGASTGGFTQLVLEKGANKVYAIDVGHSQLDQTLKEDPRVINLEKVNLKNSYELPELVDLAVVDVSFISLTQVLPTISSLVKDKGKIVCLFKPQFEVGAPFIGKNGVVKSQERVAVSLQACLATFEEISLFPIGLSACAITGKQGNQEYFLYLSKDPSDSLSIEQKKSMLRPWNLN